MIKFLGIFIYISTIMAIVSTLIICLSYMGSTSSGGHTPSTEYASINSQIRVCRIASLIFSVLSWFVISCEPRQECLKGYLELSETCYRLGFIWIVYSFVCVAICLVMIVCKKDSTSITNVSKFRNSGFLMGAIFMICSFVLNVG